MDKNAKVIGTYKCGCGFGPVRVRDRLEYCGKHGEDIAREYELPKGPRPKTFQLNNDDNE